MSVDLGSWLIMMAPLPPELRLPLLSKCYAEHCHLAGSFYRQFGKHLGPTGVNGYMWEALLLLPEKWVPGMRAASTEWRFLTMSLVRKEQKAQCYVGSVRVPPSSKNKFSKEYIGLLSETEQTEDDTDLS